MESKTEDEEQVEEKDQELLSRQSTSPPLEPILPSTSYFAPLIVVDSMSSPAFNSHRVFPPSVRSQPYLVPLQCLM